MEKREIQCCWIREISEETDHRSYKDAFFQASGPLDT